MSMTALKTINWKRGAFVVTSFIVTSSLALWAWNTVAGVVGAPSAQYKHVLAALLLLALMRLTLAWPRHRQRGGSPG